MARRPCFQVVVTRDLSTLPDEEWDVFGTGELFRGKFRSLKAAAQAPDVRNALWETDGVGAFRETEWNCCDEDGRETRDYLEVRHCNGDPIPWSEYQTFRRRLGVRPAFPVFERRVEAAYKRKWQKQWMRRRQKEL